MPFLAKPGHRAHYCKVPINRLYPIGIRWQCSKCKTVWEYTGDVNGLWSKFVKSDIVPELEYLATLVVGTRRGEMVELADFSRERMRVAFAEAAETIKLLRSGKGA